MDDRKTYIRDHWREVLDQWTGNAKKKVNGETSYICPLCGHGENGDGLTFVPGSKDKNTLKCFGCGFAGDVIDLWISNKGCSFPEALRDLSEMLGMPPEAPRSPRIVEDFPGANTFAEEYFKACAGRIRDESAVSYLQGRGISVELAERYGVGYDPEADPAQSGYKAPRIIIPTSGGHYVARAIDPDNPVKKCNPKGVPVGVFNLSAFSDPADHVIITEGVFDALSLLESGFNAAAINSTSNTKLIPRKTEKTIIIAFDSERKAIEKANEIAAELDSFGVSAFSVDLNGGYNDINDFFTSDGVRFRDFVSAAIQKATNTANGIASYIRGDFLAEQKEFSQNGQLKTGFPDLDRIVRGLFPAFYVVAGISSLGKSTFAYNLADNVVRSGGHCLFFSLEQTRLELVCKGLSRLNGIKNPKPSFDLRFGGGRDLAERYADMVGDRFSIIEGGFDMTVSDVRRIVKDYVRKTGVSPLVIVDYLQILKPEKVTGNTKTDVDSIVYGLKILSRDMKVPVLAVCSVNRSNYLTPVDFSSLKESGSIEFTADVVLGMQLSILSSSLFDTKADTKLKEKREAINAAKLQNPRSVDIVVLKNRFGRSGASVPFAYYADADTFVEASSFAAAFSDAPEV